MTWSLLVVTLVLLHTADVAAGAYPPGPNRFLGSCLDSTCVKSMETDLSVSSQERDSSGRLVMQIALTHPRYQVEDPQTAAGAPYTDECMINGQLFYGANQPSDGSSRGEVNGTLILDMGDWDTSVLASMVAAVIAEEVVGYKVALNYSSPPGEDTMRMSSARRGICTPTHFNVEVWTSSSLSRLRVYFNESYLVGRTGYYGRTGLYTTHDFVLEGANSTPPYFPGFWMHYTLISKLDVAAFKSNPKYYPPAETLCPNGTMGCENNCEKSEACTNRENAGKDCLVIAMMKPEWDKSFFQAVVSNIGIPAYFCFIGYDGVNKYASDAADSKTPVMFIHWEPDMFHVTHKGLFDRVFLPRTDPARVKLATGDYGENGYGKKTNNPLDVDYPTVEVAKYAASIVKHLPIGTLFSKLTLSNPDINDLLSKYSVARNDNTEPAPYFRAACNWVKTN